MKDHQFKHIHTHTKTTKEKKEERNYKTARKQ